MSDPTSTIYFHNMSCDLSNKILFKPFFFNLNIENTCLFCLFDLILYVPSTIFQLCRDGSSWVEPVLSLD